MMLPDQPQPIAENSRYTQPLEHSAFDVIVIGGGPAGTTAAALLAEFGHSVLVLERHGFPRFHVGESLIPETYWTFERLGVLDWLRESACPKKFSVQFVNEDGKESRPFYFDEHNPHECSQTWQIVRSEFDQMMLDNAAVKGATIRTDAQVLDVLFEDDTAVGVRVKLGGSDGGGQQQIAAAVVIDATGQSAFLANRLGLKTSDPKLRMGSVWTYYRGSQRDTGRDEGATIILQTEGKKSWFWYIPLADDAASIGVTGTMSYLFGNQRGTPAEIFDSEVARCPGIQRRIHEATRCGDFHTTKDFSYHAKQGVGPGWLLVGDAFGFIDPVYSSGVFLALKSGEFAADAVHEALQNDDLSAQRLGCWQQQYREGVELFRKLVYAFYSPDFSFGSFMKKFPHFRGHLVDILIGNVFKPGLGEMFEAMGDVAPPTEEGALPAIK